MDRNCKNDNEQFSVNTGFKKEATTLTDDQKHEYRYFLQYKFIPDLVTKVSEGVISRDYILNVDWWESFIKKEIDDNFFFEWDKLHFESLKISDTYVIALYVFPQPRQTPDAVFGAVLINTTNNDATYYTLEFSFGGNWLLGSMNKTRHLNYGKLENPGLKSFIYRVLERAKNEGPIMELSINKES